MDYMDLYSVMISIVNRLGRLEYRQIDSSCFTSSRPYIWTVQSTIMGRIILSTHVLTALSIRDFRLIRTPECKYHRNVKLSWFFVYIMHLYVATVFRNQVSILSDEEVVVVETWH